MLAHSIYTGTTVITELTIRKQLFQIGLRGFFLRAAPVEPRHSQWVVGELHIGRGLSDSCGRSGGERIVAFVYPHV